ncbi:urease accessory protein UreE [Roseateles sp. GG27B]
MLMIHRCLPQGDGLATVLIKRAPVVALDWDLRQRSRFTANDEQGRELGVVLPRGQVVRGGDVLLAEDGSLLRVVAAPQPVLIVTLAAGAPAFDLLRAAYHLGNRHVPLELQPGRLLLEPDSVLAEMLQRMGLRVEETLAGFEPEGGAYAGAAAAGHGHSHEHEHSHGHENGHGDHSHPYA